jgi:hypothetical protein
LFRERRELHAQLLRKLRGVVDLVPEAFRGVSAGESLQLIHGGVPHVVEVRRYDTPRPDPLRQQDRLREISQIVPEHHVEQQDAGALRSPPSLELLEPFQFLGELVEPRPRPPRVVGEGGGSR